MSETTDPTAGERCPNYDAGCHHAAHTHNARGCEADSDGGIGEGEFCACTWTGPAEPDAGDVEALAKALYEQIEWGGCDGASWERTGAGIRAHWTQAAERLLASGWLDAVRRKAGAKALTDLADDIDSTGYGWTSVVDAERFKDRLRDRADRIARESR